MKRDIADFFERLVEKLRKDYAPEKIILFGSYAYGVPNRESDIDLLIIKKTNAPIHRRIVNVRRLLSPLRKGLGLDVIVLTPEELKARIKIGDQFMEEIMTEGKVLYGRERIRSRHCLTI